MNSRRVKAAVLAQWRFRRNLMVLATECGDFNADVVGTDGTRLEECEVKVSRGDFLADFRKDKHAIYAGTSVRNHCADFIPHFFYFAVPCELGAFAASILTRENPNYGLILVGDGRRIDEAAKVYRRAKQLHDRPLPSKTVELILARASSELARWHIDRAGAEPPEEQTA